MMNKLRVFGLGVGRFASFFITFEQDVYYPYKFSSEALTRDWENVGNDLRAVLKKHNAGIKHGSGNSRE